MAPGPGGGLGQPQPPILLPWSGVTSATRKNTGFARYGVIQFRDGDNWAMTLIVPEPGQPDPYTAGGWSNFSER